MSEVTSEVRCYCSFCGKSSNEVLRLFAGPCHRGAPLFICNECVSLCADFIAKKPEEPAASHSQLRLIHMALADHDRRLRRLEEVRP